MKLQHFKIFLLLLCIAGGVNGQVTSETMSESERRAVINRSMNDNMGRSAGSYRNRELYGELGIGRGTDSWGIKNGVPFWRGSMKPTKHDREAISVAEDILITYKDFLKDKNTGIFRLHDASVCGEETFVVNADSPCPNAFPGKATSYSFRLKKYQSKDYSDIFLEGADLLIKGYKTLGIMTSLGEQPLDKLSLTSDGIKQLSELEPPQKKEEFESYSQKIAKGVQVGDHVFSTKAQLKSGATYLLRVIAFRGVKVSRAKAVSPFFIENDRRDDVIVIFQAVRENDDKSWVILWKELARKDATKIKF